MPSLGMCLSNILTANKELEALDKNLKENTQYLIKLLGKIRQRVKHLKILENIICLEGENACNERRII